MKYIIITSFIVSSISGNFLPLNKLIPNSSLLPNSTPQIPKSAPAPATLNTNIKPDEKTLPRGALDIDGLLDGTPENDREDVLELRDGGNSKERQSKVKGDNPPPVDSSTNPPSPKSEEKAKPDERRTAIVPNLIFTSKPKPDEVNKDNEEKKHDKHEHKENYENNYENSYDYRERSDYDDDYGYNSRKYRSYRDYDDYDYNDLY